MRWPSRAVAMAFSCVLVVGGAASAAQQFSVSDFGAISDGQTDAGPGIRKAIEAARNANAPAEVLFEPGRYRIASLQDARFCFAIEGAKDLTLRGVGEKTEIVIADPRFLVFSVTGCTNVWLKNLTVDYDPVPFTQGTIVAVDQAAGTFELTIEEGYPLLSDAWFGEARPDSPRLGHLMDAKERRLKPQAPDHLLLAGWTPVSGRAFRITVQEGYRPQMPSLVKDDRFVIVARSCSGTIDFVGNHSGGMENVTLLAGAGLAVAACDNEGMVEFRRCSIRFNPDTTRLITTNGDGFHCRGNREGPVVEEGFFEGMPDDTMNVYCWPTAIDDRRSPTEYLVSGGAPIRTDDRLQIYDPTRGVRGEARVVRMEPAPNGVWVVLDQPIEGVVSKRDSSQADSIYNLSACGEGFVFRNNTVGSHRRHGILVRAPNGLIEGNTFDRVSGNGVAVSNEPGWPEGPVPNTITIRNNRFIGCGESTGYNGTAICVMALRGNGFAVGRPVANVAIDGNQFVNQSGPAIFLAATEDAVIRGNEIRSDAGVFRNDGPVIELHDSAGVVIVDNTIDDPRSKTTAGVEIAADVELCESDVTIDNLNARLAPSSNQINDKRVR